MSSLYPHNPALVDPFEGAKKDMEHRKFVPNERICTKCLMLPGRYFCSSCLRGEEPTCVNCVASITDMTQDVCECVKHG